jgi:hypothetical protein
MDQFNTRTPAPVAPGERQGAKSASASEAVSVPQVKATHRYTFLKMPDASSSGVRNQKEAIVNHIPFVIEPEEGIHATNNPSSHPIISINGMNMSEDDIRDMGQNLSNIFGRPALVIPNHTEGVPLDIRNCIAAAFSDRRGILRESDAANNLVQALSQRMNDTFPIEINAYSQGTLITYNVLNEVKSYLTGSGNKEKWDSLAERIELRTYGAAIHRWPSEIQVSELRHISDPVSVIGDMISIQKGIADILALSFASRRARVTLLHEPGNPHSISKYVDNGPAFILKQTRGTGPKEQAGHLINSMRNGEFSSRTYENVMSLLHEKARSSSVNPVEANKSIILSRELALGLSKDPVAAQMLTSKSVEHIQVASHTQLRPLTNRRHATRVARPGSGVLR